MSKSRKKKTKSSGLITLKRCFLFLILVLVLGAGLTVYWFFSSGKAARLVSKTQYSISKTFDQLISKSGFTLKHIVVDGRIRTPRKELFAKIDLKKGQHIHSISLDETLRRIQDLPWIHSVRLERRLPNTLFIKLIEKHPVAFWQSKKKHYLVDTYGEIIGQFPLKSFPGYIVATGDGAAEKLPWLVQKIGHFEDIYAKTTGAVFVSQRRWNLILDNFLIVKLPEDGIEEALERVAELDKEDRLSSKDVDIIDLRSKGKVYFYLSKAGLKRRKYGRGKPT